MFIVLLIALLWLLAVLLCGTVLTSAGGGYSPPPPPAAWPPLRERPSLPTGNTSRITGPRANLPVARSNKLIVRRRDG
jgi:hypothetical protein